MKRIIILVVIAALLLLGTVVLAQSGGGPDPPMWYTVEQGTASGGGYYLASLAWRVSGTAQPCAWDHPFRALPPDGTPRISGGDTLIIASGSYMMGYGAPGADTCYSDGAYDCHMPPIPGGPKRQQRRRRPPSAKTLVVWS